MVRPHWVLVLAVVACTRPNATTTTTTTRPASDGGVHPQPAPPSDDPGTSCEPELPTQAPARPDRVSFEQDGKWGFRDAAGAVVIAARYVVVTEFNAEGTCGVVLEDGSAQFIDVEGRPVARAMVFDNGPDYFVQGRARVVDGNKVGFIDRGGKLVVPPKYDAAGSFCDGLAPVCMGCKEVREGEHTRTEGGQWGFVDRSGAVVVPVMYDDAQGFIDGTARVRKAGRDFSIDRNGRELPAGG